MITRIPRPTTKWSAQDHMLLKNKKLSQKLKISKETVSSPTFQDLHQPCQDLVLFKDHLIRIIQLRELITTKNNGTNHSISKKDIINITLFSIKKWRLFQKKNQILFQQGRCQLMHTPAEALTPSDHLTTIQNLIIQNLLLHNLTLQHIIFKDYHLNQPKLKRLIQHQELMTTTCQRLRITMPQEVFIVYSCLRFRFVTVVKSKTNSQDQVPTKLLYL